MRISDEEKELYDLTFKDVNGLEFTINFIDVINEVKLKTWEYAFIFQCMDTIKIDIKTANEKNKIEEKQINMFDLLMMYKAMAKVAYRRDIQPKKLMEMKDKNNFTDKIIKDAE